MATAIELTHVSKSFQRRPVLTDISFRIDSGQIIGLLGANGAGKSTLINIMTGLTTADQGTVRLFGQTLKKQSRHLRRYLGIAPQSLGIYEQLTVKHNLLGFGGLSGLRGQDLMQKYQQILPIFDLQTLADQKAASLSGGQKRRLHSAIALMNHAKIVFLDEPTVGADIDSRQRIIEAVKDLSEQGTTVIYTTHYLQEMEALNADIVFLHQGRIIAESSMAALIQRYAKPAITLYFQDEAPDIAGWTRRENCLTKHHDGAEDNQLALINRILAEPTLQQHKLMNIKIEPANLESAYRALLSQEIIS